MKFSESLKKNREFAFVYQNGTSYGNRYLVMYRLENHSGKNPQQDSFRHPENPERTDTTTQAGKNRLGISVSKKVGNSVVRHRLTRLIREAYRLNEEKFVRGLDLVVIARPGAKERSFLEIESALLHLARKLNVIRVKES